MKKLLTVLCAFVIVGAFSISEVAAQPSFGLKGGLNFANLNNVDGTESRTGFMAGAYVNIGVPMSPVSIQPEVLYSQLGAEDSEAGNTVKIKLDYIQVPVLAKFDFASPGPVAPNVYFGPYIGFNVNAEAEVSDGTASLSGDIKDEIKDTDFGVVVGAGVDITKFNIGVRYGAGLTKVFEDDSDGKNGVFSIVAGINF